MIDTHIETAEDLELVMKHYNLIEYFDNYPDSVGSLYQFRRDEQPLDAAGNAVNTDNSSSFKYKSGLLTGLDSEATSAVDGGLAYRTFKNEQILVLLKYILSSFRSAEISFINPKIYIELSLKKDA